jgi:Phytanoyl-CoA dioxygenase (PhyH)
MSLFWSVAVPMFILLTWSAGIWIGTSNMNFDANWIERQQQHDESADATHEQSKRSDKHTASGWRWIEESLQCQERALDVHISESERTKAALSKRSLRRALNAFKRCGVVVLRGAMASDDGDVDTLGREIARVLAPFLESRERVFSALERSGGGDLDSVYEQVRHESMFASGDRFRERNLARIDVELGDHEADVIARNPLVRRLLETLLGDDARLDSVSGVVALPEARDQHWHRDTPLLFEATTTGGGDKRRVHERHAGVHLPPFAVNVFVPLVDRVDEANGATEFTLASHMWGDIWRDENESDAVDKQLTLAKGDVLFFDLRTVHRGRANRSQLPRPLLMLVYGRAWWHDPINYAGNYGGKHIDAQLADDNDDVKQRTMFNHLVHLWQSTFHSS